MPVPLLPIVAAGATGLAGLSFASVLPEDPLEDAGIDAPPTSTNPDSGLMSDGDNGGFNVSLLAQIAGFIALLVFGRTIIQEIL